METKDVFEKSSEYGNKIKQLRKEMEDYAKKCTELWNECNHEIVFKYNNDHPRMMIIDGDYFCPACGQTIECIHSVDIIKSPFKNSKIIQLSNLSLYTSKELYSDIRGEVYFNYDFYYNPETDVDDMQNKMENVLMKYDSPYDVKRLYKKFNKDK
jgi:hypothetical protein